MGRSSAPVWRDIPPQEAAISAERCLETYLTEINEVPLLNAEEELELGRKIQAGPVDNCCIADPAYPEATDILLEKAKKLNPDKAIDPAKVWNGVPDHASSSG